MSTHNEYLSNISGHYYHQLCLSGSDPQIDGTRINELYSKLALNDTLYNSISFQLTSNISRYHSNKLILERLSRLIESA